ncbi:hypothetical protein [Salidesulfovibrio onnuriiensis]|uniref:hypothetical protein n=1 Tax=Salidesulfovibrio onnuriiensis TaxID=2583823 RepID=UPI0011CC7DE8|nr:hypothetical protein [Salidesulfovibrio onnuriiensis]
MRHETFPPDPAAANVVRLVLTFGDSSQAIGTAFLVSGPDCPHLVTALHNFTGGVSAMARKRGDRAPRKVLVTMYHGPDKVAAFSPYQGTQGIFRMHPRPEENDWCDIASVSCDALREWAAPEALDHPFWELAGIDMPHTEKGYAQVEDMYLPTGKGALLFGFPGGRDYREHPIGVSCALAAGLPRESYILLSGHMHAGCSGAPVVAREFGGYFALREDGPVRTLRDTPVVDQWLGLYSGRLLDMGAPGLASAETQVGVVWTPELVREVVDRGVPDSL